MAGVPTVGERLIDQVFRFGLPYGSTRLTIQRPWLRRPLTLAAVSMAWPRARATVIGKAFRQVDATAQLGADGTLRSR
jgi:hypothetical protein